MPVHQGPNKKWAIGKGKFIYPSESIATKAMRGMYAKKNKKRSKNEHK